MVLDEKLEKIRDDWDVYYNWKNKGDNTLHIWEKEYQFLFEGNWCRIKKDTNMSSDDERNADDSGIKWRRQPPFSTVSPCAASLSLI